MEDKKTQAYKIWFDNMRDPAPAGVWNSIANELDTDQVWVSISQELDLEDVWSNLEAELPKEKVLSGPDKSTAISPKRFWPTATLVLLALTTPISENQRQNPVSNSCIIEKQTTLFKNNTETSTEKRQIEDRISATVDITDNNRHNRKQIDKGINAATKEINQQTLDTITITSQPTLELQLAMDNEPPLLQSKNVHNPLHPIENSDTRRDSSLGVNSKAEKDFAYKDSKRKVKWRFGVIGSIQNTWLINNKTTNGLKRSTLSHTKITFGKEFGIALERNIGKRSFLQTEYYLYSEISQQYQEYIDALYQNRNIALLYQKLQIAYSRRALERNSIFSPYILGGVYASKLIIADSSIGSEDGNATGEYSPWDYGILLGVEKEFRLNDNLIIVPRLKTSYGIRNIFYGNSRSSSDFNKTNTGTIGLSIAIKYQN